LVWVHQPVVLVAAPRRALPVPSAERLVSVKQTAGQPLEPPDVLRPEQESKSSLVREQGRQASAAQRLEQ